MSKPVVAIIAVAIAITSSMSAWAATPDPRGACKTDYEKFCTGTAPGGGRVVACLMKQRAQLSETCRQVLDSRKK